MSATDRELTRLRPFIYITVENAPLYRSVMRCFIDARERFTLHLRPSDVTAAIELSTDTAPSIESALQQLCEWGNLERHPDTADVATVEEFYRPRFLYQLTPEGEAAERAVSMFEETLSRPGELQAAALSDIRALLETIAELAAVDPIDEAAAHLALSNLRGRFDELTTRAQAFMASVQRGASLRGAAIADFLAYKETLINYLERFIGELRLATADIADLVQRVERRGVDRLLRAAAERDVIDRLDASEEHRADAERRWRLRWTGLRAWFLGQPGVPSQAEVLRSRARAAIPALLAAVGTINDRRLTRSDRVADLRTLARWFAETDREDDLHRLWRAAFALSPARHLRVDAETVDARDAAGSGSSQTSWLDAPAIHIAPRLRAIGRHAAPGRPPAVVDLSHEKAMLRAEAEAQAAQLAAAQRNLATGRRTRLSELSLTNSAELELFLDLLGEALANRVAPGDVASITSIDGSVRVTLEPVGDGTDATIVTALGDLRGPDHWITIEVVAEAVT
jgi:uncharacterized protein (TIGR02677 family)